MANPHVPAVHMNTRFLVTTKRWFGGGADLNPALPVAADTAEFKAAFRRRATRTERIIGTAIRSGATNISSCRTATVTAASAASSTTTSRATSPPISPSRRMSGGRCSTSFPRLVRRHMADPFTEAERIAQLRYRGLYAEFNLVYDRGTTFGLKTGGNVDAILMSLPPLARWD